MERAKQSDGSFYKEKAVPPIINDTARLLPDVSEVTRIECLRSPKRLVITVLHMSLLMTKLIYFLTEAYLDFNLVSLALRLKISSPSWPLFSQWTLNMTSSLNSSDLLKHGSIRKLLTSTLAAKFCECNCFSCVLFSTGQLKRSCTHFNSRQSEINCFAKTH